MGALTDIANLLLTTLFNLYLLAVLLRFLLQWARADFYNPISQFLVRATNPPLKPLRRIIPGLGGFDLAAVILAVLVQLIGIALLLLVNGYTALNPISLLIWSLIGCVAAVLNIYFFAILISIILSWVAPGSYHPAVMLLRQLTEPVMAPFRKLLPSMGGLDLSPILVFITINILQIVLRHLGATVGLPRALVMGL